VNKPTPEQVAREELDNAEALMDQDVLDRLNKYAEAVSARARHSGTPLGVFAARIELLNAIQSYAYDSQ
jgi:hypothetical protein